MGSKRRVETTGDDEEARSLAEQRCARVDDELYAHIVPQHIATAKGPRMALTLLHIFGEAIGSDRTLCYDAALGVIACGDVPEWRRPEDG